MNQQQATEILTALRALSLTDEQGRQRRNEIVGTAAKEVIAVCPEVQRWVRKLTYLHRIGVDGAGEIIAALGWLLIKEGVSITPR